MSFNVGSTLLRAADEVRVVVNTDKFGPRQIKAYSRMCKSGIITGYSAPAIVARYFRSKVNAPTIRRARYSYLEWTNLPNDSVLWDNILTEGVALRVAYEPCKDYYGRDHSLEAIQTMLRMHQTRPAEGCLALWGMGSRHDLYAALIEGVNLSPVEPVYGQFDITVWNDTKSDRWGSI